MTNKNVLVFLCFLFVGFDIQIITAQNMSSCIRSLIIHGTLTFYCPLELRIQKFDIDDIKELDTIEKLKVTGINGDRGPLTFIPTNICALKQLKHLDLSYNQIRHGLFSFSSPCLSKLEILDLNDNYLTEIPVRWISQMSMLKEINLAKNQLTNIPIKMFYNISNIEKLNVNSNKLTSFELWLIQIKTEIYLFNNSITHFTNNYNIDLSKYQSNITASIFITNDKSQIDFNDNLFEMVNRCGEITSTNTPIIKKTIGIMHNINPILLNWRCSCEQYYLREYVVGSDFTRWKCSNSSNITYREMCSNQTSFNTTNFKPRLCEINKSEPGDIPIYVDLDIDYLDIISNISDLETLSTKVHDILINNSLSIGIFTEIIDEFNKKLQSNISLNINQLTLENFQNIINYIENFISSINTSLEISINSVSILSLWKNSSINSYSQINQNETLFDYSTDTNYENYTTTITIDQLTIENLSPTDIYTFYYLPSSLFQYANKDQNIIIISPIVGLSLPKNSSSSSRLINMSFIDDTKRSSGKYSCVFWQSNQWNETNCFHSVDLKSNRHSCFCNHTTSFALIFIPDKTISQTYIPSIIIAIISIICFCISIILSIYRQAINFRYLSMTNIFTLLNSIILFLLLTIILIQGYRSNEKINNDSCTKSQENLVITTYFFLISTFASRTFLGICYFLTIFFHFIFIQLTILSNKWFYIGFFLVIIIALIPTIILIQSNNLVLQYQSICWLNSSIIFRFISIPIIIFISLNILIIFGITIRLLKFSIGQKLININEKRLTISMMIWIALCIVLGIAWIFGPFLDVFIKNTDETSSIIKLWFFEIFLGLEGLWVLIVNVIFYINQKVNKKNRQMFLIKNKK